MKKISIFFLMLFLLFLSGCSSENKNKKIEENNNINIVATTTAEQEKKGFVGGRDEHGCIPSAGYSWCEIKQKCLRIWEEKCEEGQEDNFISKEFAKNMEDYLEKRIDISSECKNRIKDFYKELIYNSANYSEYTYTNIVINPFNKERFMIRKLGKEECGRNGSMLCDLVVERANGQKEFVANLLFPNCFNTPDGKLAVDVKNGATLLEFIDKNNLIMNFGYYDHGGGGESIAQYNLTTKQITDNILSIIAFDDGNYINRSYEICYNKKCLALINYFFEDQGVYDKKGVFYVKDDIPTTIKSDLTAPYEVGFKIEDNYKNPQIIKLIINKNQYQFNFISGDLVKSN